MLPPFLCFAIYTRQRNSEAATVFSSSSSCDSSLQREWWVGRTMISSNINWVQKKKPENAKRHLECGFIGMGVVWFKNSQRLGGRCFCRERWQRCSDLHHWKHVPATIILHHLAGASTRCLYTSTGQSWCWWKTWTLFLHVILSYKVGLMHDRTMSREVTFLWQGIIVDSLVTLVVYGRKLY